MMRCSERCSQTPDGPRRWYASFCLPQCCGTSGRPIRLVDASFVDAVLHQSHSDRLFEARLKDGGTAFVYVLLEHKAAPDPGTPLQMLGYMVRIWQRYAEDRASRLRRPRDRAAGFSTMAASAGAGRCR